MDPLTLLEVQLVEARVDDDDCIIVDDDIQTDEGGGNEPNLVANRERKQLKDPLHIDENDGKQSQLTSIWITSNINKLALVSAAEGAYRKEKYPNVYNVLKEPLHCTVCLDHIGCDIRAHPSSIEHPILKVLMCLKCNTEYKNAHFEQNEKGKELTCRWCGKASRTSINGEPLRTCEQCPFSFCERCIINNSREYNHQPHNPWTCFFCNIKELWPARGTLWALHALRSSLLASRGSTLMSVSADISNCCKGKNKYSKSEELACPPSLLHNFDLDQIIAPHLLSESSEHHLYSESTDQLLPLNNTSLGLCHSTPKGMKIVKPRAKPKPKPKAPKTKAKKQQTAVPQLLVTPTEHNDSSKLKSALLTPQIKPHWLRNKIVDYMTDFDHIKAKLENIEKSINNEETDEKIENIIGDVTTLLSLHGDLLQTCRSNLSNEWNERKARAVIEKYNSNKHEMNPLTSEMSPKATTMKINNKRKLDSNAANCVDDEVNVINLEENRSPDIKNCFVKLKKLRLPVPIIDNNFTVKLEK